MKLTLLSFCSLLSSALFAQPQTAEDSLHHDLSSLLARTTIGGYGNVRYLRDFNAGNSTINLERFVLFVGHKFTKKISFFSELEVEDAKVSGGEEGGEVALEQCYLKFNLDPDNYFVAGLFLPRIGILNEDHLPNTFNGNERTQVETFIIPSTWRELGAGFYGNVKKYSLYYSVGLVNGLNSAGFEHGSLIREGRYEGRNASANNLAVTAALQFYKNNFRMQLSGYYGGSVGLSARQADSLKLEGGAFGTPVMLGEADVQYQSNGISIRALGCVVSVPDATAINRAYANNTPESAYGAYGEIGYNLFHSSTKLKGKQLVVFARYEALDMSASIPTNGLDDETLNQQHITAGLNYLPVPNVAIKGDVRLMHTGNQNPDLVINPGPGVPAFRTNNTFLNLGIAFSF